MNLKSGSTVPSFASKIVSLSGHNQMWRDWGKGAGVRVSVPNVIDILSIMLPMLNHHHTSDT